MGDRMNGANGNGGASYNSEDENDSETRSSSSQPDIGLGNIAHEEGRQESSTRREEATISFRHFLNSQSRPANEPSTFPDLYNCSQERSSASNKAADTSSNHNTTQDVGSILPDFVQDHLAVEQCYFQSNASPIRDNTNLPDFASSSVLPVSQPEPSGPSSMYRLPENSFNSHSTQENPDALSERVFPNFSYDLMGIRDSLEIDITDSTLNPSEAVAGISLPDFLSDGHVHNPARRSEPQSSTSHGSLHYQFQEMTQDNVDLQTKVLILEEQLEAERQRVRRLEALLRLQPPSTSFGSYYGQESEIGTRNLRQQNENLKKEVKRLTDENSTLRTIIINQDSDESLQLSGNPSNELRLQQECTNVSQELLLETENFEFLVSQLEERVRNFRMLSDNLGNIAKHNQRKDSDNSK